MKDLLQENWIHTQRTMIAFVRGLFAQRNPGELRWDADDGRTEIYIAADEPEDQGNMLPRVLVSRGNISYVGVSPSQSTPRAFASQEIRVSDLQSSTLIFTAAATLSSEAHAIGMHVFRMIVPFREMLIRQAHLHTLQTAQMVITQPGPMNAFIPGTVFNTLKAVQVHIPCFVQENLRVDATEFYPAVNNFVLKAIK